MYHIGMVIETISPAKDRKMKSADASVQAMIKMWDENLLILQVEKKIAGTVAAGDYVLADYTPVASNSPYRKMVLTKVLGRAQGDRIWQEFKREYTKRKEAGDPSRKQMMPYIR